MSRVERIGRATLYLGDCRDILPTLSKVDAVVTDPPYGIGEAAGRAKTRNRGINQIVDYGNDCWDDRPIGADLFQAVKTAGRWNIIFGGNYYDCPPAKCWLVWDKCNSGDFADCELAWTNLPKAVRIIRYLWNGMIRESGAQRGDHPTQKPLEVMKWCIGHLPEPNKTILDPFMGSGTTGVAAIQMGRDFVGIEREERYFEAACRRIREASGEDMGPLFVEAAA
jgi:site-specific DNA-methyltransferase (adenine-specific)/modification methylase